MPALDLASLSLAQIKTELDVGLATLISALDVAEKFTAFIPGPVGAEVKAAVAALTAVKALVDKL